MIKRCQNLDKDVHAFCSVLLYLQWILLTSAAAELKQNVFHCEEDLSCRRMVSWHDFLSANFPLLTYMMQSLSAAGL